MWLIDCISYVYCRRRTVRVHVELLLCMLYFLIFCRLSSVFFFFFLMIRRPPRSTLDRSSAASDVYKRQMIALLVYPIFTTSRHVITGPSSTIAAVTGAAVMTMAAANSTEVVQLVAVITVFAGLLYIALAPVSYTHLRAHETVLDLVCRLLLVKKKKSTT